MAERRCPQLGLVSTAHRLTTSLVPEPARRRRFGQLADPVDLLIVEWSAPRDVELDDRAGWLAASPFWHARRERLIEGAWLRAQSGSVSDDPDEPDPVEAFRSQWLNIWPERLVRRGTDEPLLADGVWRSSARSERDRRRTRDARPGRLLRPWRRRGRRRPDRRRPDPGLWTTRGEPRRRDRLARHGRRPAIRASLVVGASLAGGSGHRADPGHEGRHGRTGAAARRPSADPRAGRPPVGWSMTAAPS